MPPPPFGAHRMPRAVLTGGEPLLQADKPLIAAVRQREFYIAVEGQPPLAVADGRTGAPPQYRGGGRLLPGASAMAACHPGSQELGAAVIVTGPGQQRPHDH